MQLNVFLTMGNSCVVVGCTNRSSHVEKNLQVILNVCTKLIKRKGEQTEDL